MGNANDYNERQLANELLTFEHISRMVEYWQRGHHLAVDGFAGPNTLDSIFPSDGGALPLTKVWPLAPLPDGREPIITSGFHTENHSRPTHMGCDMFYRWLDSDPDVPVGDGGAIKRNGKRRWWYPPQDQFPLARHALAAMAGIVTKAGKTKTGYRCWVDHGGIRTGYFHLSELLVGEGVVLHAGDSVGIVGDNPSARDALHLHFELSPSDRYAPRNPRPWLRDAKLIAAA